jgi:deoxyribodipyrimidine photo-lyase
MWRSLPFPGDPIPAPPRLPSLPPLFNDGIPDEPSISAEIPFRAGEAEAQQRLAAFADSPITRYAEQRNRLDLDGTSGLSPYLRFGMISARQAVWAARQVEAQAQDVNAWQSVKIWQDELIWREFYATILYHFPTVRSAAFRPNLRRIHWRNDPSSFAAWCEGRTGYPVVDAAMRQLNSIGWMHNRGRMLVASFLTKDLLIDWRLGERYFMQQLLDGDPASNNGGWQWTAGTGSDAAPYFRLFNPILQGMKFDPQGRYVRRWLPELASVPDSYIHTPWKMSDELQRGVGCLIGKDYPAPIVDHAIVRQRALETYRSADNIR